MESAFVPPKSGSQAASGAPRLPDDDPRSPSRPEHRIEGIRDSSVRSRGPRLDGGEASAGGRGEGGPRRRFRDPASNRLVAGARDRGRFDSPIHGDRSVSRWGDGRRRSVPELGRGGGEHTLADELIEIRLPVDAGPPLVLPNYGEGHLLYRCG